MNDLWTVSVTARAVPAALKFAKELGEEKDTNELRMRGIVSPKPNDHRDPPTPRNPTAIRLGQPSASGHGTEG